MTIPSQNRRRRFHLAGGRNAAKEVANQGVPEEVAVELSPGPNSLLSEAAIKRIIDQAEEMDASIMRFVLLGQQPEEGDYELLEYAKNKNFEIRLDVSNFQIKNIRPFVRKIKNSVDYVISYVNYEDIGTAKKEDLIFLKHAGIKIVRAVTSATHGNVKNLWKIFRFILSCGVDKWAVNRDMGGKKNSRQETKAFIEKLFKIKKDVAKNKFPLKVHSVYPIPFCAHDPVKMDFVCTGAKSAEGHERILVDARGIVKPMHYFNKKVGDFTNLRAAWNHPFLKAVRAYSLLPKECRQCCFLEKCKGGSRFMAYQACGSYKAPDPLMDYQNVKDCVW